MNSNVQSDSTPFCDPHQDDRFQYEARFPEYGSLAERLKSFEGAKLSADNEWPPLRRRQLAQAGFFAPGRPATVQCFYCGLRMEETDCRIMPWKAHAQFVSSTGDGCAYLNHMKERDFVKSRGARAERGLIKSCFEVRKDSQQQWVPCRDMETCSLCVWEFWMTPREDDESD